MRGLTAAVRSGVALLVVLPAPAAHAQLRSPNAIVAQKTVPAGPKRQFGQAYTRRLAPLPSSKALAAAEAAKGKQRSDRRSSRKQKVKKK